MSEEGGCGHPAETPQGEIRVEDEGPLRIITLCRASARNALSMAGARELRKAFRGFDTDESVSVGIVQGEGGTFCAGADLEEMSSGASYEAWAGDTGGLLGAPLSKPLIAAVCGHAVAGGLGLALYCDLRVADRSAVFGVFCRRFGVPMSDGTTVRLPRLIGESRALDMMLTGRPVRADEAFAIGLVSEVTEPGRALARAKEIGRALSAFPQSALRSDRMSLLRSRGLSLLEALGQERHLAEEAKRTDARAGAARFAEGAGRHGGFDDV